MHQLTLTIILCLTFTLSLPAQVRLNVAGEARVTGDYLELLKPGNTAHHLRLSSSGSAMDINATTDLYLNSGGNILLDANNLTGRIGLGTAGPAVKFHVVGDAIRLSTPGNDNRYINLRTDGDALDISPVGASLYIDPGTEKLILSPQSGYVGIGTEVPTKKLSVVGETQIQGRLELFRSPGDSSLFIGINAGINDDGTNNDNTFIGTNAGWSNTDGYLNTFLGSKAGDANTTGFSNTFLGGLSGYFNVDGVDNAFVGALAGFNNQSGSLNTFLGTVAGFTNVAGTRNTFVGKAAGYSNDFGINNTFFGMDAGFANTSGSNNVAIGNNALHSNTDRSRLVAVGDSALYHNGVGATINYEGAFNMAIGSKALYANTTGFSNTATGESALFSNTEGFVNTATGSAALYENKSGSLNTAIGQRALDSNITGNSNTGTGVNALRSNKTGSNNTGTGSNANVSSEDLQNSTALGAFTITNANEKTVIGRNEPGVVIGGYVNWSNLSDGRFKEGIKENVPGLEFIRHLRPVTYWVNIDKLQRHITAQMPDTIAARYLPKKEEQVKAKQEIRTGFVAQEVEAVAKRLGYQFDGVNAPKNPTDNYSIAYGQFVPSLVKATQEQQEEIEALGKDNEALKADNVILKKENESLHDRMDELETLVRQLLSQNQDAEQTHSQTIDLQREAKLYPNRPNPFGEQTVITYYVPEGITKAQLRITAPDGKLLRLVDIAGRGPGQTILRTKNLPAGAYAYSLIVDGRVLDSRQMVIQK